jgi:hypothetical protein
MVMPKGIGIKLPKIRRTSLYKNHRIYRVFTDRLLLRNREAVEIQVKRSVFDFVGGIARCALQSQLALFPLSFDRPKERGKEKGGSGELLPLEIYVRGAAAA